LPVEKIIRSNRKTIAVEVTDNATIIVKAPRTASKDLIAQVLADHIEWINKRLEIARKTKAFKTKHFVRGEKFLYLGQLYELDFRTNQNKPLVFEHEKFYLIPRYRYKARELFVDWYKARATRLFTKRAMIYAPLMGVQYNRIKLSDARKRWGSCSNKGNINIVWRLIMAPLSIVDYVIVHELAHLRYMDHSAGFWRLVGSVYPEYRKAREWLKEYGNYLDI